MTAAAIRALVDAHLKPLLAAAVAGKGAAYRESVRALGGILVGYGLSLLRGDGMTEQQIQDEVIAVSFENLKSD